MSRRRRDDADIHGLLNVCKARGYTSHDVVAVVRRALGTRRVGHAGTLDPLAEGVLPICVGRYTRLVDLLGDTDKGYYAELLLGARTTTDDAEGEIVEERPVPALTAEALAPALDAFRGPIIQVPPAFSAIKVAGRRAYDLARRGDAPVLAGRPVTIHRLEVVAWEPPRLTLLVVCSKGTYIRSIARDLGEALGCGAHLTRLVRLWVGSFGLETAVSLDEIQAAAAAGRCDDVLLPADTALSALPALLVPDQRAVDIGHGRPWPAAAPAGASGAAPLSAAGPRGTTDAVRVYDTRGRLLAMAEHDPQRRVWQPRLALVPEPAGGATRPVGTVPSASATMPTQTPRGGHEHDG
jgi:tRNA pseudouridine55 synthase